MNLHRSNLAAVVCLCLVLVPAPKADARETAKQKQSSAAEAAAPNALADLSGALEAIAQRVGPSVVQIYATGYAPGGHATAASLLARRESTGTGAILSADGYIVTNAHVVGGAHRIRVVLPPEQTSGKSILQASGEMLDAELVGVDLETDLALLHIDRTDLRALTLADSDAVRAGQIVLAFGSPLGLENSVSMGVVSATARQLGPEAPMIYLQTDATINPGNSGGPLVDASGAIIGINTLIYTKSGGSEGIGFAAPSNIVRAVYEQLRETGKVRRGTIGIHAQTIDATLARGLDLPRQRGALLGDVVPESPAANAGLRVGDIVLSLNGKPMENGRQLDVNLYHLRIGDAVVLEVLRGDERFRVPVALAEQPDAPETLAALVSHRENILPALGILALELDDRVRRMLPRLRNEEGVIVAARSNEAMFRDDGLREADVIYSVNRRLVTSVEGLRALLDALPPGSPLAVQIERSGQLMFLAFEMN